MFERAKLFHFFAVVNLLLCFYVNKFLTSQQENHPHQFFRSEIKLFLNFRAPDKIFQILEYVILSFELFLHGNFTFICENVCRLVHNAEPCKFRVYYMRRELEILIVLFHQQRIVLYLVLLIRTGVSEGLRTDYQMIDHLYLTVGEKHMIESCITLQIASYLVCYVVLG